MNLQFPERRDVKLRNVQCRVERHGEQDVPAIDLAISVTDGNRLLDMLHGDLRGMFFKPVGDGVPEGELDLPVDDRPALRVAGLKPPIKLDREHVGMTLKVHFGASGKADIVLGAVRLHNVRVANLIEGGSVEVQFTLSTTDVNEKTIGKLSLMQQHEVSITLTQAEAQETKQAPVDSFLDPEKVATQQQTPEQALIDTAEQPSA